jgi:hypothetical protein
MRTPNTEVTVSDQSDQQQAAWAPVVGVVIAGAITTANAPGYWDPLNSVMGIILLSSLHFFERNNPEMRRSLVYALSYAFCLLMIIGILYDALLALLEIQANPAFYVKIVDGRGCICWNPTVRCKGWTNDDFIVYWRSIGMVVFWLLASFIVWFGNRKTARPQTAD